MSKYTTEVRYICEHYAGLSESKGFDDVDAILEASYDKVFNFDFPIFDEAYRKGLIKKILLHYYTREIGEETVGLWKLRLKSRLWDIMPYYNKLYESELIEFNPLYDVNLTRQHNTSTTGNVTDTSTSKQNGGASSNNVQLFSDTPQGAINPDDLFLNENGATYLTNAQKNNISSTNISNNRSTNDRSYDDTIQYLEQVSGKTAGSSMSKMLMEYRESFLNIDKLIIDELSDLFMNIW